MMVLRTGSRGAKPLLIGLVGAGLAFTSAPAAAQDDVRGESVSSRERDRLDDSSIQLGSLLVTPQVSVNGSYEDNIYATDTDRRGDFYLTVRPEVAAHTTWSRNSLDLTGYYERNFHAKYSTEDTSNYGVAVNGRYDISGQTRLYLGVAEDRNTERRGSLSSFLNSAEPVRFNSLTFTGAGEQDLGNLKLRAEGRFRRLTYSDAILSDGTTLNESFRNLDIFSGTLQARYDLNTLTQFVVRGTAERRRYDLRPGDAGFDPLTQIDRSGDSTLIEVGVIREVTALLFATVRIGYLNFRYPDPTLNDVSAFSYFGNVHWNITPLTTINATATRRVDETTSPVTAGNLRDEVTFGVDHELLRSLIISGNARYAWINPAIATSTTVIVDGNSREQELGVGFRYYIGRKLRMDGDYNYQARTSSNKSIAYRSNTFTLGLNYLF